MRYVLDFEAIDRTQVAIVGGKGASLGELARIEGVRVPPGFCVTTEAFARAAVCVIDEALSSVETRAAGEAIAMPIGAQLAEQIRRAIEAIAIPEELAAAVHREVTELGEHAAYAVRSSATAEDSPTNSFAGQHDSYLNIVGTAAILDHIRRCWASLFSERASTYRARNGIDHRTVRMAVVVQRMVVPHASGVLFTADPVSGHRKLSSIEAIVGLGEELVSGRLTPDSYQVRDDALVAKTVVTEPVLTDAQAVRLAQLGRRIEAHFGQPQDIEWCLAGDDFEIVQSRPITTLFPIPEVTDGENHVYISVGHQQMMTDAMKPLGLSLWQLSAGRPMFVAGGRLFVDVARALASPAMRAGLLQMAGQSDPLIGHALQTVLDRGFIQSIPDAPVPAPPAPPPLETDPAIVRELIARNEASVAALQRDIQSKSGPALLDFILADIQELKRLLVDPLSHRVTMAGMEATWWLNEQLQTWLGEKNAADTLALSVENNVTSEMGLALMAVADVIRPHPEVVAFLHHIHDDDFLDELAALAGGREARDALCAFLVRYGMRCAGEIDITRPRWREQPSTLVPIILGNVKNFEPRAGARRFEHGRQQAAKKEQEILARVRTLPDGAAKADEVKRMIDRLRTFIGYREYPKYGMVCRYAVYKQALMTEAERLVRAGVLREQEDIFWLSFHELHDAVRANHFDDALVHARKEAFRSYRALAAPRVLTSDGEGLSGAYLRDDVPAGALIGLAVSGGTIEGRARVLHDIANADLEPGDILVTRFTDPSWTPLFVAIAGLVTEVGGLMTHGAVIAREYGVPAVVGVERATRLIRDGQRIRVHGTEGYVEILARR